MNFLAHAVVASWHRDDPEFLFGAMLPDFASMGRARLRHVTRADVAEGVRLHHDTDRVFHESVPFQALLRAASADLLARGVSRGGARGAAHVGVELLLDGELLRDGSVAGLYSAGMRAAADPVVDASLVWADARAATRWREVHALLRRSDGPPAYDDVERVARGVVRALGARPRLALNPDGETAVLAWLREARETVRAASDRLLADVRERLA